MNPQLLRRWTLVGALAGSLAACGGGGGGASTAPPPPPPPPPTGNRGDVVSFTDLGNFTRNQIDTQTGIDASLVNDTSKCPVDVVSIQYVTVDPSGAKVQAGAGLLVPADESLCPGPHPLLSHQHGTSVDKTFDTASKATDSLAIQMSALYASHGYVVVMPNYLGYAGSVNVDWHGYLQYQSSAQVVVDAMRAARNYLAAHQTATQLSGDVYLSGTSQGGYVTLATQRVIEASYASEFALRKVAPTSGPYDLEGTFVRYMDTPDSPDDPNTTPAAFAIYGFQRSYLDVYTNPSQVFRDPWAAEFAVTATPILPGPYAGETQLRQHCALPFNLKDPGGQQIGNCSNAPLLQAGFVTDFLNQTTTFSGAGVAARRHTRDNTLVVASGAQPWTPATPVTFCYGDLDPMASPNAVEADALARSTVVDVQVGPGVPDYILAFMAAGATDKLYHGNVEGPGCTSYTRNVVFPILY